MKTLVTIERLEPSAHVARLPPQQTQVSWSHCCSYKRAAAVTNACQSQWQLYQQAGLWRTEEEAQGVVAAMICPWGTRPWIGKSGCLDSTCSPWHLHPHQLWMKKRFYGAHRWFLSLWPSRCSLLPSLSGPLAVFGPLKKSQNWPILLPEVFESWAPLSVKTRLSGSVDFISDT